MSGAVHRGDLVIVDFSTTNASAGVRPALVVQNDRDNSRMGNTIVVQVTTMTRRAALDTQHLIDPQHPDWQRSGLIRPSVVNCSNIATVPQADLRRVIGSVSATTMQRIDDCLRSAVDL